MHPASGSTLSKTIARYRARHFVFCFEFRKHTSAAEIDSDIDSLRGYFKGSAHSICHLSSRSVNYRTQSEPAIPNQPVRTRPGRVDPPILLSRGLSRFRE